MRFPPIMWDTLSASDLAELIKQRGSACLATVFLDCHQWVALCAALDWESAGGFASAQFRCAYAPGHQPPIQYWTYLLEAPTNHGAGVRAVAKRLRNKLPPGGIGDIYSNQRGVVLAALPEVEADLLKLGAVALSEAPEPEEHLQRTSIASVRLDAVCAAIFHVSREEAQRAIDYQFVHLNFTETGKRSVTLRPGDQLIYRTKGRAVVKSYELNPRSKRYWLEYALYPS